MARTGVTVTGLSELGQQLARLRVATGRAALTRAGTEAMEPMARLARSLAPKDTEELAESIDVGTATAGSDPGTTAYAATLRAGGSKGEAVTALRGARRATKGVRGDLYVDVFMGPEAGRSRDEVIKGFAQEFGTALMAPNPYMRPAWEQDHAAMLERLSRAIWFEVSAAIEGAAARGTLRR
jgi:HK97 gp10 family phage protein